MTHYPQIKNFTNGYDDSRKFPTGHFNYEGEKTSVKVGP
jgi:hypothetical protein